MNNKIFRWRGSLRQRLSLHVGAGKNLALSRGGGNVTAIPGAAMIDRTTENGRRTTEAEGRRGETVNHSSQGNKGEGPSPFAAPSISIPKTGTIRGIGEKFAANPVIGTLLPPQN